MTAVELSVHERQQEISQFSHVLHYLLSMFTPNCRILILLNITRIVL